METKKLVCSLVVVVVVVAVVAAVVVMAGDDDSEGSEASQNLSDLEETLASLKASDAEYPSRLLILGNADLDLDIDEDDIAYVEDLIENGYTYTDDYFADANYDGLINQEDVDTIQRMIESEQDVVYYFNVDYEIASYNTSYPLHVGNVLTQSLESLCILCPDYIVATDDRCYIGSDQGDFYTEFMAILDYDNLVNLGSHKNLDAETLAAISQDNGGYFTIWANSTVQVDNSYLETQLSSYDGIQIVRLPSWENGSALIGQLTAAYLFSRATDGESWENGTEYAEWQEYIMKTIADRTDTLDDDEKKKVIVTYVSDMYSEYHLLAGISGEYQNLIKLGIIDVAGEFFDEKGLSETYYYDMTHEEFAEFYVTYGVDVIIGTIATPYALDADDMAAAYDLRSSQLDMLDGTDLIITGWINASGPGEMIFCMLVAKYLYPDLFEDFDLEEIVNTFCQFMGNYGNDSANGYWCYSNMDLLYCGEGSEYNILAS